MEGNGAAAPPIDILGRDRQEMAKRAARNEAACKQNIELITKMFLSLGADCIKVTSSRHDAELAEAGLATHRWSQLLGMEQKVQRDAAAVTRSRDFGNRSRTDVSS